MVAVEHLVRFYIDQSAMGLGLALTARVKTPFTAGTRSSPSALRACSILIGFPPSPRAA
jgi:hypothetical protein